MARVFFVFVAFFSINFNSLSQGLVSDFKSIKNADLGNLREIVIANGVYCDSLVISVNREIGDSLFIVPESKSGVILEAPIVLKGSFIVFKGFIISNITQSAALTCNNLSHSRIAFNFFKENGSEDMSLNVVDVIGESNKNRFDHNIWVRNKARCMALRKACYDNLIEFNSFKDTPNANSNKWEMIQLNYTAKFQSSRLNTTIRENIFEGYQGDMAEVISVKSSSNYLYRNIFYNCKGHLTLRRGNGNFVYENIFIKSNGVRVSGENHKIFENGFIYPGESAIALMAGDSESELYSVAKNITIIGNYIFKPVKKCIVVGKGYNWKTKIPLKELPSNLLISNNQLYSKQGISFLTYQTGGYSDSESPKLQFGNKTFSEEDSKASISELIQKKGVSSQFLKSYMNQIVCDVESGGF